MVYVVPHKKMVYIGTDPFTQGDASPDVAPPAYSSPSDLGARRSEPKSSIEEESRPEEKASFAAPVAVATTNSSEPSYERSEGATASSREIDCATQE